MKEVITSDQKLGELKVIIGEKI